MHSHDQTERSPNYLWNYVVFFLHLQQKKPEDFTGGEHYVFKEMRKKRTDWFPSYMAQCFEELKTDAEVSTAQSVMEGNMKELQVL
jgi:hypothetical protein